MPDYDRRRRKVCSFCLEHIEVIDYKESPGSRRYLLGAGQDPAAAHDRYLRAPPAFTDGSFKRARHIALLPFAEIR